MPPSAVGAPAGSSPPSSLPVATGLPPTQLVLAQEHLVRRVRGVGLALVDPGRVGVDRRPGRRRRCRGCRPDRAGSWPRVSTMNRRFAGRSSRVAGDVVRTGDQRVVGLQRHEDGAAALDGLVDAVVEELTEQGEQRVVRRREADVGGDVRDEQRLVRRRAVSRDCRDRRTATGPGRWCTARRPGCPGSAPGTRPRRSPPGWSRSGRRSGC